MKNAYEIVPSPTLTHILTTYQFPTYNAILLPESPSVPSFLFNVTASVDQFDFYQLENCQLTKVPT